MEAPAAIKVPLIKSLLVILLISLCVLPQSQLEFSCLAICERHFKSAALGARRVQRWVGCGNDTRPLRVGLTVTSWFYFGAFAVHPEVVNGGRKA
jgi:hypothetical protein